MSIPDAMRARYCAPEWSVFFEVANSTGSAKRYADAVAMNLYPSRGLEVNGFEFKQYRSDWLRELKNPAKAEDIYRFCDRWWVVATPDVVKLDELPVTWGYLECKDGKLRQVKAAPALEAQPLSKPFVAALVRRAGQIDAGSIAAAVGNARQEIEQKHRDLEAQRRQHARDEGAQHRKAIDEFEKASGIRLNEWDAGQMGSAVKLLLNRRVHVDETVTNAADRLEEAVAQLRAIATMPALAKPFTKEEEVHG